MKYELTMVIKTADPTITRSICKNKQIDTVVNTVKEK